MLRGAQNWVEIIYSPRCLLLFPREPSHQRMHDTVRELRIHPIPDRTNEHTHANLARAALCTLICPAMISEPKYALDFEQTSSMCVSQLFIAVRRHGTRKSHNNARRMCAGNVGVVMFPPQLALTRPPCYRGRLDSTSPRLERPHNWTGILVAPARVHK